MIVPGRSLARSRLFRWSLVTVYGIGLVLCLLAVAGAVALPKMPSRWPAAAIFAAASVMIGWRLCLYRRTYITGSRPPVRRLLLVFLPLSLLAAVGLLMALGGLGFVIISFKLTGFTETSGVAVRIAMSVFGGVVAVIGGLLMTPLLLALRARRPVEGALDASPDPSASSEDASAT